MKSVTLTAPSYSELKSVLFIRKLYIPPNVKLTGTQNAELCKRFAKGYEKFKDDSKLIEVMGRINKYMKELESTGVNDYDVKAIDFTYAWFVSKSFWQFILLHIYLIVSLPLTIITLPFAYWIQKKAEKERIAAKLKNPNKILALDVVSSIKVQYSVLCLPLIYIIWLSMFYVFFSRYM